MNFSRHLWAIAAILAVLTAVSVSSTHSKTLAKTSPLQVFVTNSTSNPVPTAAQGTTQVAGSVAVNNAVNNPVHVHEVAVRTPVSILTQTDFNGGDVGISDIMYTVPTGKLLVIENEYFTSDLPNGQKILDAHIQGNVNGPQINFTFKGTDGPFDVFSGQSSGTIYVAGGSSVYGSLSRDSSTGLGPGFVGFEGYLVDAQ